MNPSSRLPDRPSIHLWVSVFLMLVGGGLIASCSPQGDISLPDVEATSDAWQALLEVTPLSYTTPQPDPMQTPLDGTYAKLDPSWPQWWLCRRCADYRPAGGIWKLQFNRGVMRILYDMTGWRSIASYSVIDERLYLFNDPFCPQDVGEYDWRIEDRRVTLEVIDDPCSFGLRAENLSSQPWASCPLPDEALAGEYESPLGCRAGEPPAAAPSDVPVIVTVHPGNSRFYNTPPDLILTANQVDHASQEGILISFDENSISYGLNRVLWWDGDWIEIASDQPFASMGVQFMGDPSIGWARVLFDGEEVWHGNTSQIWSEFGRHGGYVEVSAIGPGLHTMRVESMGFDYRPVTVAWFGFSYQGSARPE